MSGKLTTGLKGAIGLFSAEKIVGWGKAIFAAAGQTDEFKDRFADINASVSNLQTALAGPLYAAIEGLLPAVDAVAEGMEGWGDNISNWIITFQRATAALVAENMLATPGDMALEEFDRKVRERQGKNAQKRWENSPEYKANDALVKKQEQAEVFGTPEYAEQQKSINELKQRGKDIDARMRALALDNLKKFASNADFSGKTTFIDKNSKWFGNSTGFAVPQGGRGRGMISGEGISVPDLGNIIKETFRDIGAGVAGVNNAPGKVGSAVGDVVAGAENPFKSGIEDFGSLVRRIQGGAASDAEDAAKKTAAATQKTVPLTERVAKATEGMWDAIKGGLPAVAG
jgi:hypothetical protein